MIRRTFTLLTTLIALGLPACTGHAKDMRQLPLPALRAGEQKAIFAMGCFWCAETAFEGLPGVRAVISGFDGGNEPHPTYEQVSAGGTGHAESVCVIYDTRKVSYAQLLELFWHNIDPTSAEGQFCDRGHQYRSAIFYVNDEQKRLALASKRRLETTPQRFKDPIVTEITPATTFWPAEEYHQDFYRKDPAQYHDYREGCGRDRRLIELWGKPGRQGHA
jgi:peptide-methionine (S)-S-oxide reductase